MGASTSTVVNAIKGKKKRDYNKIPEKRLKERYDPEENTSFTTQHDASIDKVRSIFDMIVFDRFDRIGFEV